MEKHQNSHFRQERLLKILLFFLVNVPPKHLKLGSLFCKNEMDGV